MAVDHLLVNDAGDKLIIKTNKLVTVDDPDDCECCGDACPTDCTACGSFTVTVSCPTRSGKVCVYTHIGSSCTWSGCGNTGEGISFGNLSCIAGVWTILVSGLPFPPAESCPTVGVAFTKAAAGGCPPTGSYTSDTVGWTCTVV